MRYGVVSQRTIELTLGREPKGLLWCEQWHVDVALLDVGHQTVVIYDTVTTEAKRRVVLLPAAFPFTDTVPVMLSFLL